VTLSLPGSGLGEITSRRPRSMGGQRNGGRGTGVDDGDLHLQRLPRTPLAEKNSGPVNGCVSSEGSRTAQSRRKNHLPLENASRQIDESYVAWFVTVVLATWESSWELLGIILFPPHLPLAVPPPASCCGPRWPVLSHPSPHSSAHPASARFPIQGLVAGWGGSRNLHLATAGHSLPLVGPASSIDRSHRLRHAADGVHGRPIMAAGGVPPYPTGSRAWWGKSPAAPRCPAPPPAPSALRSKPFRVASSGFRHEPDLILADDRPSCHITGLL